MIEYDQVRVVQVTRDSDRRRAALLLAQGGCLEDPRVHHTVPPLPDAGGRWLLALLDEAPVGLAWVGPRAADEPPAGRTPARRPHRPRKLAVVGPVVVLPGPRARIRSLAALLVAAVVAANEVGYSRLLLVTNAAPPDEGLDFCARVLGFRPAPARDGGTGLLELGLGAASRWLRTSRHLAVGEIVSTTATGDVSDCNALGAKCLTGRRAGQRRGQAAVRALSEPQPGA